MADFRKPKYSGSLNLAPECGPVLIELDTDAKTATASLEDPASQYTLAGGGGGLDYVIPEQTFQPLSSNPADNVIQVNAENLVNGDTVAMTVTIQISQQSIEATTPIYGEFSVTEEETSISANTGMFDIIIATEDNINWFVLAMEGDDLKTFYKLVIKAIKY